LAVLFFLSEIEAKMKNELISALKNQLVVALIIAGTITIAAPIFVCGAIGVFWDFCLSLALSKAVRIARKLDDWRQLPTRTNGHFQSPSQSE
jgi:hypothetical protein